MDFEAECRQESAQLDSISKYLNLARALFYKWCNVLAYKTCLRLIYKYQ